MKQLIRLLAPMAALIALMALAPACGSDDGDTTPGGTDVVTGTDTGGGGVCDPACNADETCTDGTCVATSTECDPACDANACMTCQDGACVSSCKADETCDGAGTCEANSTECDPACNADACETCTDGACVVTCEAPQVCDGAGACADPAPTCDPACDADACQTCDTTQDPAACVSTCDADACETCDGAGGCASSCDADTQYCDEGECKDKPTGIVCANPNADGYCDASIIDELAIATAPDDTIDPPDPGCCCDFTGDGINDNAVANLIKNLGPMMQMSLEDLNQTVADAITDGSIIVMFEYVGMAAAAADTDYFNLNFFLGEDTDDDATNNFAGDAEVSIMAQSLDVDGNPLIVFEGADVASGQLHAGPSQFVIPVQLPEYNIDMQLTVDAAELRADISEGANGYELDNGQLCGYITKEEIFGALNGFVVSNCACLGLSDPLIIDNGDGTYACAEAGDNTCDPEDDMESICPQLTSYCGLAVSALPMLLDIDLDGDEAGDAVSVGATFGATSVQIVNPPAAD